MTKPARVAPQRLFSCCTWREETRTVFHLPSLVHLGWPTPWPRGLQGSRPPGWSGGALLWRIILLHWPPHSPEGELEEGPWAHTPPPGASALMVSVVFARVPCRAQHSALIRAALGFPALALIGLHACPYLLPSSGVAHHMHWTRGQHSCKSGVLVLHGSYATAMQSPCGDLRAESVFTDTLLGARVVSHSPARGWSWRLAL